MKILTCFCSVFLDTLCLPNRSSKSKGQEQVQSVLLEVEECLAHPYTMWMQVMNCLLGRL